MKYVHYWHFHKAWYAKLSESKDRKQLYWHNSSAMQDFWNKEYLIEDSTFLTHREIKAKLIEAYPEYTLVKDRPFHEGRRWFGYKQGSR